MRDDEEPEQRFEHGVVGVVETIAATVGCGVIAGVPLWLGIVAGRVFGPGTGVTTFIAVGVAVVLPAITPMPRPPTLNGYERWGHRVGTLLRAPINWRDARLLRRSERALGALSSSSSAAAPSLGARRD